MPILSISLFHLLKQKERERGYLKDWRMGFNGFGLFSEIKHISSLELQMRLEGNMGKWPNLMLE